MLRDLLRLVTERGTTECDELARALGTSPELVRLALAELVRRGYFQPLQSGCAASCGHCPLHSACLYRRQPSVWILTRKGEACGAESREALHNRNSLS